MYSHDVSYQNFSNSRCLKVQDVFVEKAQDLCNYLGTLVISNVDGLDVHVI